MLAIRAMKISVQLAVAIGDGFLLDREGIAYPLSFAIQRNDRLIHLEIDEKCVTNNVVRVVRVALEVVLADDLFGCVQPGEKAVQYKLPSQGPIDPEIDRFYRTIYKEAGSAINFLITCFRVAAHQTWLNDIPTEDEYIGNFFRRVQAADLVVDGQHHDLAPAPYAFTVEGGKHVANAQRLDAVRALASAGRIPLAAELLANAERLWERAHYRAAVVEIGAAIEATLHRFAARPDMSRLNSERIERLGMSMDKIVGELGIRGSIRILLPLLVPTALVDDYAMELVIAAIDLRNEVVHNGKRNLDKEHVWDCLIAARELYEGLPMAAKDPEPA
jgi:hypothetical protein